MSSKDGQQEHPHNAKDQNRGKNSRDLGIFGDIFEQ